MKQEAFGLGDSRQQLIDARAGLARQIPAFLVVGALGFCVDAGITVALVNWGGVWPMLARVPAFAVATLFNFLLNRAFTFRASAAPWPAALARYVLVCLGGLAVNYAVFAACLALAPRLGLASSPLTLTLFVACGTVAATVFTFSGFRAYAFR